MTTKPLKTKTTRLADRSTSDGFATLVLWALQSPINTGMILRAAEGFGITVSVFDPHGVFANADKLKTISDFACGALQRLSPRVTQDEAQAREVLKAGRTIATSIDPNATQLTGFRFRRSDLIILGNEYDGLPDDLANSLDVALNIPMPDGYMPKPASNAPIDPTRTQAVSNDGKPNLNVAISAGILCYHAYMQGRRHARR